MSRLAPHARIGAFGIALGFTLAMAGFADFGEMQRLFRLESWGPFVAYGGGVALAGAGFALLRGRGPSLPARPLHPGIVPGGLLFGAGWALTGGCPGVVLVQIGEGKLVAAVTAAGVVAGTWLGHRVRERIRWDTGSCG